MNTQANADFPADLFVELDRSQPRGLRVQLEHALRQAVTRGSLPAGALLPPSRVLAAELGVSRSLVVGAYEQLVLEGYLEARQGAGTRVRAQATGVRPDAAALDPAPFWPVPVGPDGVTPRSGLPDPALSPRSQWLRHYGDVLREMPGENLLYPPPRG